MGDRTFSAEDVIRIYEDFLTSSEQETVEMFFAEMAEEPQRDNFFVELEVVAEAIEQARRPLPGLFNRVLRLVPFLATLVTTVQFATERAAVLVRELLNEEEISA